MLSSLTSTPKFLELFYSLVLVTFLNKSRFTIVEHYQCFFYYYSFELKYFVDSDQTSGTEKEVQDVPPSPIQQSEQQITRNDDYKLCVPSVRRLAKENNV